MSEKYPVGTAKKAADLDGTYAKVKTDIPKYGFKVTTELKSDVVKKAMTDSKKSAEFVVEAVLDDKKKIAILQLYCEVPGKMKSVLGRGEITSVEQYKKATALAGKKNIANVFDLP